MILGGGVMKMKGNLISLISIIFIMLASMAMTGKELIMKAQSTVNINVPKVAQGSLYG